MVPTEDSVFDDRRNFRRFPTNVVVRFRVLDIGEVPKTSIAARIRDGVTKNLSTTGLFLSGNLQLKTDTILEVSFTMPNGREAKVLGKIMWLSSSRTDPGCGVEVFKTSEDEYADIVLRAKRGEWIVSDSDK